MKIFITIFLCGTIILGVIAAVLYRNASQTPVPVAAPATAPVQTAPPEPATTVTPLTAQVFTAAVDVPAFAEITTSTKLSAGSRVKTSATGRALIEDTNTTVLDSNTEITMGTLDPQQNQTILQLHTGSVWSRIKKISDKGEFFEIETQNARVSVRGTSFGVTQKDSTTTLVVTDGLVRFHGLSGFVVMAPGGKKVVMQADAPPVITDIDPVDARDTWFQYNNPEFKVRDSATSTPTIIKRESTITTAPKIAVKKVDPIAKPAVTATSSVDVVSTPAPADTKTDQQVSVSEPVTATPQQDPKPAAVADAKQEPAPAPIIQLRSISPNSVKEGSTTTITLTGFNFASAKAVAVLVGKTRIVSFTIVNDTTIQFTFNTRNFPAGQYNVTLEDAAGNLSMIKSGLTVTKIDTTAAAPSAATTAR